MNPEFLDKFECKLQDELLRICTSYDKLKGFLLSNDDIDEYWHKIAPEYMADAVVQIQDYPTVSVAWAAYLGLAVAYAWDVDWAKFQNAPYQAYYGEQGFDNMDEHIVKNLLGVSLDSDLAKDLETVIRQCAQCTVSHIRHEHIEPQSKLAFYIFARAVKVMFKMGAAIELNLLGYKFEKVSMPGLGSC